jgi:predicted PurR-regulated permease PerM
VMLMSMLIGLQLFGLLGFLIGPVIVIVLKSSARSTDY